MSAENPIRLGVNIDHIATLRQARGTVYPDPVQAAFVAQQAGADGLTVHLREDRRHIQDRDVLLLAQMLEIPMNLEMAVTGEMIKFAQQVAAAHVCLVPERREELTTEGGLDVVGQLPRVADACDELNAVDCRVSLFIDPHPEQIDAAAEAGAHTVELHTGSYADALDETSRDQELDLILEGARHATRLGLEVHAGHGLHYHNVQPIAAIAEIVELNIGHSIIARSVFTGLEAAVKDMRQLMLEAR